MVPKLANSELLLCFIQDSSISVLCCKSTWTFTQSSSKLFLFSMFKKLFSRLQIGIYYDVFEHVLEGNIHQPPLLLIAQIYLIISKLANSELLLRYIRNGSISVLCCKSTWTFTQSSSEVFFQIRALKFFDAITIIGI